MKREIMKGLVAVLSAFLFAMGLFPGGVSSGAYSGEVNFIPDLPSKEFIDMILNEGMERPPQPNPKPTFIIENLNMSEGLLERGYGAGILSGPISPGPCYFAGVWVSYPVQGVSASLWAKRSSITLGSDDAISGWIGLATSNNSHFVQTGWIYRTQEPNGPYAFVQVFNGVWGPVLVFDQLTPDQYYQFRIRSSPPNYWIPELYINGGWKQLYAAYFPGITQMEPLSFGESRSTNGYHVGMYPLSRNWYGQTWNGSQWQYWTMTSVLQQDRPYMNLGIYNYCYNIQFWGQ